MQNPSNNIYNIDVDWDCAARGDCMSPVRETGHRVSCIPLSDACVDEVLIRIGTEQVSERCVVLKTVHHTEANMWVCANLKKQGLYEAQPKEDSESGPVFSHIHCLAFHNSTIVTYTKFLSASKGSDRSCSRFGDELKSMLDGIHFDLPPDLPDPPKVAIVVPPLPLVAMSPKGRRRSRVATGLSFGSVTAGVDSYDVPISIPALRSDLPAKSIAKKQVRCLWSLEQPFGSCYVLAVHDP